MARIPMTGGFQTIPEGVHVLLIIDAQYDEDFGKAIFTLANSKGATCREQFSLLKQDGSPNEKALNAFSFFAKNAMNDFDMEDVDPVELVGRYIRAEVIHNKVPSTKDPTKMMTFVNLGDKAPADGFEDAPANGFEDAPANGFEDAPAAPAATKPAGLDLAALLRK